MSKVRQLLVLAGLTARETIRQPICLLLATSCVILTGVVALVQMHHFGEDGKLARDSGLAFHFVFGLLVSVYTASSCLSREMRSGTASAILSKPVGRETLFLGKVLGAVCVILLFSACASIATLLGERVVTKFYQTATEIGYFQDTLTGVLLLLTPAAAFLVAGVLNYTKRRTFGSAAFVLLLAFLVGTLWVCGFFNVHGQWAPYDCRVQWRILPVSLLITIALVVLACVALVFSTRLTMLPTLSGVGVVFVAGLMSDYVFGRHATESTVAAFLHGVIPNWQHFWVADALSGGGTVPWTYVLSAGQYALLYVTCLICMGMYSFRYADVA